MYSQGLTPKQVKRIHLLIQLCYFVVNGKFSTQDHTQRLKTLMIRLQNIFNFNAAKPAVSAEWLNKLTEYEDVEALKISIKHLSQTLDAVQQEDLSASHLKAHLDLIISLEERNQSRLA